MVVVQKSASLCKKCIMSGGSGGLASYSVKMVETLRSCVCVQVGVVIVIVTVKILPTVLFVLIGFAIDYRHAIHLKASSYLKASA